MVLTTAVSVEVANFKVGCGIWQAAVEERDQGVSWIFTGN